MSGPGIIQCLLCLVLLVLLGRPLGLYLAAVYRGDAGRRLPPLAAFERLIYRLCRVRPEEEMEWRSYAGALLGFSFAGMGLLYALLRLQRWLPLNPQHLPGMPPDLAFNTAVSFVTNTNWQGYGGESTLSPFSQMVGLTVQNFLSAAGGMAVLVALIRGIARRCCRTIGNFWADMVRSLLYVLLPLSFALALLLVSQGVVQTLSATATVDPASGAGQILPLGPVASQVAIKQLGTNGGGYFNVNSAHPFENPTPFSGLVELIAILLIPVALCSTYGRMVEDRRQGLVLLLAMAVLLLVCLIPCLCLEQAGNPAFRGLGVDQSVSSGQSGGNMEGKEVRFGISQSVLWAVATTGASNGSVNSMHDSMTPLGGMIPLWLILLGEVVFGGVGSGLYGMLVFVLVAVFVAGLMVGRTPEYLGKKIGAFEIQMASLVILIPPACVLLGTAAAVATAAGRQGIANPGPHGFTEILYGFASAANNNGSAFAGLSANSRFYNLALGVAMFVGRFWIMVPVLALAGSLAAKRAVPEGPGTLPTHTPLFLALLVGIVVLVGALTFLPALALGPVVEQLLLPS